MTCVTSVESKTTSTVSKEVAGNLSRQTLWPKCLLKLPALAKTLLQFGHEKSLSSCSLSIWSLRPQENWNGTIEWKKNCFQPERFSRIRTGGSAVWCTDHDPLRGPGSTLCHSLPPSAIWGTGWRWACSLCCRQSNECTLHGDICTMRCQGLQFLTRFLLFGRFVIILGQDLI